MSLKELYRYLQWRMDPDDERAILRFHRIVEAFGKLNEKGLLPKAPRVLDLCAGSGIAGVAMAKATNAKALTVLDAREGDLKKVEKWTEIAGLNLKPEIVVGDAREVAKLVGKHDVAILWGLTMPHFDAFDAVKLFANVALTYYKLPGFEKISEQEHRLWDLASQLALGSVFFKEYQVISRAEHGVNGVSHIIYLKSPRRKVVEEFLRG